MSGAAIMTTWMDQAACRGHDPELFFPANGAAAAAAAARAICGGCPVIEDCRQHAAKLRLAQHQVHGVWGGMNFTSLTRRSALLLVATT